MANATGLIAREGLELLTFCTPSGFKISIFLEELKEAYGTDYVVTTINIRDGVHKQPWFSTLNANGRIPAIVDHDNAGLAIMEGQAILQYLARKFDTGHKFSFTSDHDRSLCEQWMGFAQSHLGPWTAEAVFFIRLSPEQDCYAIQHFVGEVERLYGVLDAYLQDKEYIVGGQYSIADMANFAMVDLAPTVGIDRARFLNLSRWHSNIGSRPAVQKGSSVPFLNPLLGAGYARRLVDEPGFKEREDELVQLIEKAKAQYGYKYSSP